MKLSWNTMLLNNNLSGIGKYIENVLLNIDDDSLSVVLFGHDDYNYNILNKKFIVDVNYSSNIIGKNKLIRVLWEQFILPFKTKKYKSDILHCPAHVIPIFNFTKTIVTVHDLAFKLFPSTYKYLNRVYLNWFVPLSVKKANVIIAVSKNTKNDIIKEYNIKPEKIKVVYNGVDEKFRRVKNDQMLNKIRVKYNLPNKFILYLGTLEPRKNINRLILAYKKYLINKANNDAVKLVIAGGKGWLYNSIFALVKEEKLDSHVIFTGYIDDSDIVYLYNLASIFIYPSLYEGFGLPPLEAMACGTPVITSNVSSLPEVVGDAAIKIDPYNIDELTDAITNVLSNSNLQRELIEKGIKRAKQFSWKNTAEETLKVYREVLEE